MQNEPKEGFVNIFQGQVGRWVEGLSPATGLYTDEVKECLPVIVYGKKKGKRCFSLIHLDASTPVEVLETEKAWMENAALVVLSHAEEAEASVRVERIKSECKNTEITHQFFPKDHDAVFVKLGVREGEKLPVSISSANSRLFNPVLYNHSDHMRLYALYKFNVMLSEIQAQQDIDAKKMMGDEILDAEKLYREYQQESGYPKTRLLFDGIRFCSRKDDICYIACAEFFLEDIAEIFKEKPPKFFLEVNEAFLKCFRDRFPYLIEEEFREAYAEASCELARVYCYLTERLDLIEACDLFKYWSDMVARYSRVIALPPIKLAAALGPSISTTLQHSGDTPTVVVVNLAGDLPPSSPTTNPLRQMRGK